MKYLLLLTLVVSVGCSKKESGQYTDTDRPVVEDRSEEVHLAGWLEVASIKDEVEERGYKFSKANLKSKNLKLRRSVESWDKLEKMDKVEVLSISDTDIDSVEAMKGMKSLQTLLIEGSKVQDLTALSERKPPVLVLGDKAGEEMVVPASVAYLNFTDRCDRFHFVAYQKASISITEVLENKKNDRVPMLDLRDESKVEWIKCSELQNAALEI